MQRYVYFFGQNQAEGGNEVRRLVGGKGASLADMTRAGLNVPPGFTISAECCALFFQNEQAWPGGLEEEVRVNLARLEAVADRRFGAGDDPLLVAVRSGAAQSMPGMMDTVLNVGLNPESVRAIGRRTGKARGAWHAYVHFLLMFARTVGAIDDASLQAHLRDFLNETGKRREEDLDPNELEILCDRIRGFYHERTRTPFPVEPWDMLRAATQAVFLSWNSDRASAYRKHHHIDGLPGTAVNVQMMCPAEVSGVMFTAHPVQRGHDEIIIESSFGLGESVVLGKVTPDRFVIDRSSLVIRERVISDKEHVTATLSADDAPSATARDAASLADEQVLDLARLGLRVEEYFKVPCDIEWALARGQFYLLQARPIKFSAGLELESVRQEEIDNLRQKADPAGTVWSRYNLSEILPEPTPLTWDIVRRFMSGRGGFGLMYRDLGFDPDPALDDEGMFDLVCGRPYCNLSREPRMQYRSLPFEHPFALLKANPQKAMYPQAIFNPAKAGWRFWAFLPALFFKLVRSSLRLRRISRSFAQDFQEKIVPAFLTEVEKEAAQDYGPMDQARLRDRLHYWIKRTLDDFARDSLKPTALAGIALGNLERVLATRLSSPPAPSGSTQPSGLQRAQAALRELAMGLRPQPEVDLAGGLSHLSDGRISREEFLRRFGHRGRQEMELARPRWHEDPSSLAGILHEHAVAVVMEKKQPAGDQKPRVATSSTWDQLMQQGKFNAVQRTALEKEVQTLKTYLGLRESAKHHLLRGYAIIRKILVEIDRRLQLEGDVFFLTLDELTALLGPSPPPQEEVRRTILHRKKRREIALSLPVPQVLFSDDLEAIGRHTEAASADILQGVPLSAGIAEGMAWVVSDPADAKIPEQPYILVCPSTDPAWLPLFLHARGLLMETGGVLSHGAIVAREFNLPAIAGLPDVQRRLSTGQKLRIDGGSGKVIILAE